MTQPTSHGKYGEETKTSLSTPGGSGMQTRGRGGEKKEQTVVPFSDISTPLEGRDFIGAEGMSQKRCCEFVRGGGSSPPNDLATHAKGNGALSNEMEGETETPEEEKKDEESKGREERETFNSSGVEPTERGEQNETELIRFTEVAVDQKKVEEGVMKMLVETD